VRRSIRGCALEMSACIDALGTTVDDHQRPRFAVETMDRHAVSDDGPYPLCRCAAKHLDRLQARCGPLRRSNDVALASSRHADAEMLLLRNACLPSLKRRSIVAVDMNWLMGARHGSASSDLDIGI